MPGHEPGRRWLTRPFDTFYEDPFQSITIIGCYGRSHMEGKWQGGLCGGDLKVKSRRVVVMFPILLSFVQWLHVGARSPGTRYNEHKNWHWGSSARTQWIAESLHREKYFNILPKFLVIFHPCHYSCSQLTVTLRCHSQRIAWSGFRARAELPKPHLVLKLVIPSIIYFARKYFLLLLLRVVQGSKEKRAVINFLFSSRELLQLP